MNNKYIKKTSRTLLPLVAFFSLWEIASQLQFINNIYFPPPTEIIRHLVSLLTRDATFLSSIQSSTYRLVIAFLIATPTALLVGISIALNKHIAFWLTPIIAVIYPIPKLAIFPFLLIIFGIGDASKIAIIAVGIFFLVLLSTIQGIERLKSFDYIDIVHIYKVPFWKKIYHVIFKGSLHETLNGIKIGLGYGLVMVIAGEFTISKNGIGFFMWNAWDQFRILDLYSGLVIISFFGLVIFNTIEHMQSNLPDFKKN